MRKKVHRWVRRPNNWRAIQLVSLVLTRSGEINGEEFSFLVGFANGLQSAQKQLKGTATSSPAKLGFGSDRLLFSAYNQYPLPPTKLVGKAS